MSYQIIYNLPFPIEINNIIFSFIKQKKYNKNYINNINSFCNYYNINKIKQNNIFYNFKNKKNYLFKEIQFIKEIDLIMFNNFSIISNNNSILF